MSGSTMPPTRALDGLLALSALMTTDIQRFEREHGLTTARVHLLWQLGAAGPSTQRDLAEALRVTPRNVTGLVDGLVGSGHVTREPHPGDRRATQVTLTAAGSRFVTELQRSHQDLADRLFGDLPEDRLVAFVAVLDETLERFAGLMGETGEQEGTAS
ncbi:MarR family winged helix-turn-helix transcriptional regulator [Nocardioides gansuensis]|nr:MarR family winged helix-turn-helix transcriptional regulator [Nocardioides gansuensis]